MADTKLLWFRAMPGGGRSTYVGGYYCGPGWGFTNKDFDRGFVPPPAIDAIDAACKAHDQCYDDHGYLTQKCNVRLAADLVRIVRDPRETPQRRRDAAVMAAIFAVEAISIDEKAKPWKASAVAYRELHTYISRQWDDGVRTMESILQDAYVRLYAASGGPGGGWSQ